MKRLLILCVVPFLLAATVWVGENPGEVQATRSAYKLVAYMTDNGLTPQTAPAQLGERMAEALALTQDVVILGAEPGTVEIVAAINQVANKEKRSVVWTESDPRITCADLDNAILIAHAICTRIESECIVAGVNRQRTVIKATCASGINVRVRCDAAP
jgi:hypothetical protein